MPLDRLLRPPVAVVFVPAALVIGFVIWMNARALSEHFEASGRAVMYLWWLLYPLIGYYLSIGWTAAGMGTSRQSRYLGTNLALVVSDAVVAATTIFVLLIAGMFKVRQKGIRDLCRLWGMLNATMIRGASQVFGRLISAALLPVPLVAWALCSRNRPLGVRGNVALHVAGVFPGMVVFGLFLAPLAEKARYQENPAHQSIASNRTRPPLDSGQVADEGHGNSGAQGVDVRDASEGIWTGTWQLTYAGAKLTLEQRGSTATGEIQVSFGGPIDGNIRGNVLSGKWHRRYGVGDTAFEFHMERDGRSFSGWLVQSDQQQLIQGYRTSPSKPVDEAKGRLDFATWNPGLKTASLAEAGYRSGVFIMLGVTVNMDAAEKALDDQFSFVGRSENAIRIERIGPLGAALWLREEDALLVIAVPTAMENRDVLVTMEVAWQNVVGCLNAAGALSHPVDPVLRWERAAEFCTEKPDQYQRISVLEGFRDGILGCPPDRPAWAQVMPRWKAAKDNDGGEFWLSLWRGNTSLIDIRASRFAPLASFADLPFGDHALGAQIRENAMVVFDAFYPTADGRLTLTAGGSSPDLVLHENCSLSTSVCHVPDIPCSPERSLPRQAGQVSAAELGFGFVMEVPAAESLKLEPIRRAMEAQEWQVHDAGRALRTVHPDHPAEAVFVLEDGRIVGCRHGGSPGWEDVQSLEKTWLEAAQCVASVSAAVPESQLSTIVLTKARFYTAAPLQYQRLYVAMNPGSWLSSHGSSTLGWNMYLPRGSLKWSAGTWGGHSCNDLFKVGGTSLPRRAKDTQELTWVAGAIPGLTPGPQPVEISCAWHRPDYQICIETMFEDPEGQAILYDNCRKSVVTCAEYSRSLTCLLLPVGAQEAPGQVAKKDPAGSISDLLNEGRFTSELHLSWEADFREGQVVAVRQQLRDDRSLRGPLRVLSSQVTDSQVSYRWECAGRRGQDVVARTRDGGLLLRSSAAPSQTVYLTRSGTKPAPAAK